jgi:hypothetical protein
MSNTNNIPWPRISVEAVAVLVSILLAFAIDAWWEDRKERAFEQETLRGLKAEYEDHHQVIGRQIELHLKSLRAIASLMGACRSGLFQSSEFAIDEAVFFLQVGVTTDLGSGVRDALISAGRIDVLTDRKLRYMLSEWDSVLDEVTDGQLYSANFIRTSVTRQLVRLHMPMSAAMQSMSQRPWPLPTQSISAESETTSRLIEDPAFCTLIEIRYGHMNHTLDEYDALGVAIAEILREIDTSIE